MRSMISTSESISEVAVRKLLLELYSRREIGLLCPKASRLLFVFSEAFSVSEGEGGPSRQVGLLLKIRSLRVFTSKRGLLSSRSIEWMLLLSLEGSSSSL